MAQGMSAHAFGGIIATRVSRKLSPGAVVRLEPFNDCLGIRVKPTDPPLPCRFVFIERCIDRKLDLIGLAETDGETGLALPAGDMSEWAEALVAQARTDGIELTGEGGLLTGLIRQVLQTGLEVEMADHLGYDRYAPEGRGSGNSRSGHSPKRVTTDVGCRCAGAVCCWVWRRINAIIGRSRLVGCRDCRSHDGCFGGGRGVDGRKVADV